MSRRRPGRTRIRLAQILSEHLGCAVLPEDIWDNYFPAARWVDAARWGANLTDRNGHAMHVYSWDTMSECVRTGIESFTLRGDPSFREISARDSKF